MLYINIIIFVLLFVIFFFKQKTAYEMRISDWSSDVCSSDLPGRQAVAPSLHGGENGGDAGHALSARCVLAGRAGGDHQPQDDLLLRRLLPAVHRPPDGGRSEEHTSELQSLMRISYAVFCLKKKKKTQQ